MRNFACELRIYAAELLLRPVLWIVPAKHPDGHRLIAAIHRYFSETIAKARERRATIYVVDLDDNGDGKVTEVYEGHL